MLLPELLRIFHPIFWLQLTRLPATMCLVLKYKRTDAVACIVAVFAPALPFEIGGAELGAVDLLRLRK